jgi:hypothetical protein
MAKAKEIKIEWTNSGTTVGGQLFFVKEDLSQRYLITLHIGQAEKVLKGKARIKSQAPEVINEFLSNHQGWKQCDQKTYESAKNCGLSH